MRLKVEYVFSTAGSRIEGLQGKQLCRRSCAVFVYDSACTPRFHMGTVPYKLFLSSIVGGECVESYEMKPGSSEVFPIIGRTCCVVESIDEIPVGAAVDIVGSELVVS